MMVWYSAGKGSIPRILLGALGLIMVCVCPLVTCNKPLSFLECLSDLIILACAAQIRM